MKTKDLMLGDWVQVPCLIDNTENYDAWCQIKQLRDGDLDVVGFKELSYDEICPIPLTPEILARMGFTVEEEPKYDDTYTEDEYTATIKLVDSRKCEVEIEYKTYWKELRAFNYDHHNRLGFTSIETQIEYVHELQHVLRFCRIEKEIIL